MRQLAALTLACCLAAPALAQTDQQALLQVLLGALDREAEVSLRGTVLESVNFPPRRPPTRRTEELPPPPVMVTALLASNYRLVDGGPTLVAGRAARLIRLEPVNGLSATWTFAIDQQWGVRLAQTETDFAGRRSADARFLSLTGPPVARAEPVQPPRLAVTPPGLRAALEPLLGDAYLPPGFEVIAARRVLLGPVPVLQVIASDGIGGVVLFIGRRGAIPGVEPFGREPRIQGRLLGQVAAVVLGNLPPREIARVLDGIEARRFTAAGPDWLELLLRRLTEGR
jgi:negative regulator of sigma E activity